MLEKRVVQRFALIPEIDIKTGDDVARRSVAARKNLSHIYSHLYSGLYGGSASGLHKTSIERIVKGHPRNFHPDIYREDELHRVWTEVKATNAKMKSPKISERQVENYSFEVAYSTWSDGRIPLYDTAVFVYGNSQERAGLDALSNRSLVKKVANETRELIVFPFNLLYFLLLHQDFSRKIVMNQETSGSTINNANYWIMVQKKLTLLSNGDEFMQKLREEMTFMKRSCDTFKDGLLCLDDLDFEESNSPENIFCRGFRIKPFKIIKYFNRNEKKWVQSFVQNQGTILEQDLGIKALYLKTFEEQERALSPEEKFDLERKKLKEEEEQSRLEFIQQHGFDPDAFPF